MLQRNPGEVASEPPEGTMDVHAQEGKHRNCGGMAEGGHCWGK
jgi:hypothetical protein